MAVQPIEMNSHDCLLIAVLIGQPLRLLDAGRRIVCPEVDPQHFVVGKPNALVMVVIRRARMSHASQGLARRAVEWEEERARMGWSKHPARDFTTVNLQRDPLIGKWNDLAARERGGCCHV